MMSWNRSAVGANTRLTLLGWFGLYSWLWAVCLSCSSLHYYLHRSTSTRYNGDEQIESDSKVRCGYVNRMMCSFWSIGYARMCVCIGVECERRCSLCRSDKYKWWMIKLLWRRVAPCSFRGVRYSALLTMCVVCSCSSWSNRRQSLHIFVNGLGWSTYDRIYFAHPGHCGGQAASQFNLFCFDINSMRFL